VAGYSLTATGAAHGFVFNGSTLLDLNDLIGPSSVCTNLISADGINDLGQITGSGYTAAGEYHAFLLTPVFQLTTPAILAGGEVVVMMQGLPGQRFVFQASTNLFDWTSLSTNTLTSGSLSCTDAPPASCHCRFYRAQLLP
jgi:probable HAF family extracellular repeat protein